MTSVIHLWWCCGAESSLILPLWQEQTCGTVMLLQTFSVSFCVFYTSVLLGRSQCQLGVNTALLQNQSFLLPYLLMCLLETISLQPCSYWHIALNIQNNPKCSQGSTLRSVKSYLLLISTKVKKKKAHIFICLFYFFLLWTSRPTYLIWIVPIRMLPDVFVLPDTMQILKPFLSSVVIHFDLLLVILFVVMKMMEENVLK